MKHLLSILCLFVLSCDSGGDGVVHGCIDSQACNYNPNATLDNNSCEYDCEEEINESNCSNIQNGSEWDAVTLDINVLDDMAGCSYEDSASDASNLNWAFQSGVVEQNDSNPGVWTIEKYYECTVDDALKICSNQQMTNDCIIYSVEASNNSLSLTTMIVEGDECDREETLNFEEQSSLSHETGTGRPCPNMSACNFGQSESCYYCYQNDCDMYPQEYYDCEGNCLDNTDCP